MPLGVVLLLCFTILCVTGVLDSPFNALLIARKRAAALASLLLIGYLLTLALTATIAINMGPVFLCALLFFLASKQDGSAKVLLAVVLAAGAGLVLYLLRRGMAQGQFALPAPGLFMAAAACPFLYALRASKYSALLCAALAPLVSDLCETAYELYAYGYTVLALGTGYSFDAGAALLLLCFWLLAANARRQRLALP